MTRPRSPPVKIVRTLDPKFNAPREARRTLRALDAIVPRERLDDLRLVVSELVTNSVVHGGAESGDRIVMVVKVLPERVRVEVVDHGRRSPAAPERRREHHGRGLAIVDRLAERWGTERNSGTKVWAEVPLSA